MVDITIIIKYYEIFLKNSYIFVRSQQMEGLIVKTLGTITGLKRNYCFTLLTEVSRFFYQQILQISLLIDV